MKDTICYKLTSFISFFVTKKCERGGGGGGGVGGGGGGLGFLGLSWGR